MAPNISGKSTSSAKINREKKKMFSNYNKQLNKIKSEIEKNFKYVGDNLPQEVRNIYYDKNKNKNIYGKATPEEAEELREEGIELTTIPWIDNKKEN